MKLAQLFLFFAFFLDFIKLAHMVNKSKQYARIECIVLTKASSFVFQIYRKTLANHQLSLGVFNKNKLILDFSALFLSSNHLCNFNVCLFKFTIFLRLHYYR